MEAGTARLPLYLVVDGLKLIMALLAWEVVRLSTLNKIFILAHDITMTKYGMVKRGYFVVSWCSSSFLEDEMHIEKYHSWEDAYHSFRFHVFLGHGHVALGYSSFAGGIYHSSDILCFLRWRDVPSYRWYHGEWSDLEGGRA